jgi:hypothetical protein
MLEGIVKLHLGPNLRFWRRIRISGSSLLKKACLHLITFCFFFHTYANSSPISSSIPNVTENQVCSHIGYRVEEPDQLARSGFFAQAALLYWQVEEGGLGYAVESSSSNQIAGGHVKSPEFKWDFGFNIGLGYRVPHDSWQLFLQFTSFQTHTDAEKNAKDGYVFFPTWLSPRLNSPFATHLKAHWRLHLGLIDFLLSRPLFTTQTLTLTPQIGLRWGSVRQKFNLEYRGGSFPSEEEVSIRMKNKFCGLGSYAGVTCEYAFTKNFRLFAKGGVSLLYGEFYLHQDEGTPESKEKLLGLHSIYRAVSAFLEGTAGVRWQHLFTGCFKRLTFDLGWDQLLLFSQNQLLRFADDLQPGSTVSNQGDLSIAGMHFNAAFDF